VFGPDGERLAKRHGAVTLEDQQAMGRTPGDVRDVFAVSLGLAEEGEKPSLDELVQRFDVGKLSRNTWVLPQELSGSVEL
jgi:glutamyl-tRNA synthetase